MSVTLLLASGLCRGLGCSVPLQVTIASHSARIAAHASAQGDRLAKAEVVRDARTGALAQSRSGGRMTTPSSTEKLLLSLILRSRERATLRMISRQSARCGSSNGFWAG